MLYSDHSPLCPWIIARIPSRARRWQDEQAFITGRGHCRVGDIAEDLQRDRVRHWPGATGWVGFLTDILEAVVADAQERQGPYVFRIIHRARASRRERERLRQLQWEGAADDDDLPGYLRKQLTQDLARVGPWLSRVPPAQARSYAQERLIWAQDGHRIEVPVAEILSVVTADAYDRLPGYLPAYRPLLRLRCTQWLEQVEQHWQQSSLPWRITTRVAGLHCGASLRLRGSSERLVITPPQAADLIRTGDWSQLSPHAPAVSRRLSLRCRRLLTDLPAPRGTVEPEHGVLFGGGLNPFT